MVTSVILNEGIRGLGKAGDVVQVKPGYARYLISIKKVLRATESNIKSLEEKRLSIEKVNKEKLFEAEKLKASLEDKFLVIVKQSSDDGKLFGSVTSKEISKLLLDLGYNIHHSKIFFDNAIKVTGNYSISLELHSELLLSLPLYVVRNESSANEIKISRAKVANDSATTSDSGSI